MARALCKAKVNKQRLSSYTLSNAKMPKSDAVDFTLDHLDMKLIASSRFANDYRKFFPGDKPRSSEVYAEDRKHWPVTSPADHHSKNSLKVRISTYRYLSGVSSCEFCRRRAELMDILRQCA
jgi:hypothetical protein